MYVSAIYSSRVTQLKIIKSTKNPYHKGAKIRKDFRCRRGRFLVGRWKISHLDEQNSSVRYLSFRSLHHQEWQTSTWTSHPPRRRWRRCLYRLICLRNHHHGHRHHRLLVRSHRRRDTCRLIRECPVALTAVVEMAISLVLHDDDGWN